jgi:hypothetical protein
MNVVEMNYKLHCLAEEERQAMIEIKYDSFLEEMYQLWELEQYAEDAYDEDACYYGA